MKTNITLAQALNKAAKISPQLREKIKWSVDLVKKAEKIAKLYSDEGFYVAFSGGKDSQAVYHIAELAGVPFTAAYAVTTCDPPKVIKFIKEKYPEVIFEKPTESIYTKCITKHKGLLPTMLVRWCCGDFKEHNGGNRVSITGVRREESKKRGLRNEVETKRSSKKSKNNFSGTYEEFEEYREARYEKQKSKHPEEDFMNFRCIKGKDGLTIMPILKWSETDVWDFLNDVMEIPHCSLYDEGDTRIGCILCPYSQYKTKVLDATRYPHHKRKWIETILKRFEFRPSDVDKYLPLEVEEFKSQFKKETVESFGGKYTKRQIEAAEAFFDYWIKGESYEIWYANTYKQIKMFD